MIPRPGDLVVVKIVSPADKRENEVRGRITDIFGDTVRALLGVPGQSVYTRSFKKQQLRDGGPGAWRVTVIKAGEQANTPESSTTQH